MTWIPYGRVLLNRNSTTWVTFQTNTTSDQFKVGFVGRFDRGDGILLRRLFSGGEVSRAQAIYAKPEFSLIEGMGIPDFLIDAAMDQSVLQIRTISRRVQNNLSIDIQQWI
jgi:hypothetical protein